MPGNRWTGHYFWDDKGGDWFSGRQGTSQVAGACAFWKGRPGGGERKGVGMGGTKVGVKYEEMIGSAGIGGTRVKVWRASRFFPRGRGGNDPEDICSLYFIFDNYVVKIIP